MKKVKYLSIIFLGLALMLMPYNAKAEEKTVATIGNIEYTSLIDALEAVEEGQTVKLLEDISLEGLNNELYVEDLPNGATFDLNGHDITIGWNMNYGIGNLIFMGKNATIKNGSFSGKPDYVLWIGDEGETDNLLIENVTLNGGANIYNATNVVLRNISANGKTYYAVWGDENAHITIESGTYKSTGYATIGFSKKESDITIVGGTFEIEKALLLSSSPRNKFTIKAGTFNSDVSEYLSEQYECINVNNSYIVRRKEVKNVEVGVSNKYSSNRIIEESLEEYNEIDITGKTVEANIDISNIIPDEMAQEEIDTTVEKKLPGIKIAQYFDISVNVVDVDSNEKLGLLTKLNKEVTFEIALPKEMREVKNRKFYVIRKHNDEIELLDAEIGKDGDILTFKTDRFSVYAIAYVDEVEVTNPNTYDCFSSYMAIGIISAIGMIATALYLKKENYE